MRLLAEADGNVTVASSLSTKIVPQCEAAFSRASNLSAAGRNQQQAALQRCSEKPTRWAALIDKKGKPLWVAIDYQAKATKKQNKKKGTIIL